MATAAILRFPNSHPFKRKYPFHRDIDLGNEDDILDGIKRVCIRSEINNGDVEEEEKKKVATTTEKNQNSKTSCSKADLLRLESKFNKKLEDMTKTWKEVQAELEDKIAVLEMQNEQLRRVVEEQQQPQSANHQLSYTS